MLSTWWVAHVYASCSATPASHPAPLVCSGWSHGCHARLVRTSTRISPPQLHWGAEVGQTPSCRPFCVSSLRDRSTLLSKRRRRPLSTSSVSATSCPCWKWRCAPVHRRGVQHGAFIRRRQGGEHLWGTVGWEASGGSVTHSHFRPAQFAPCHPTVYSVISGTVGCHTPIPTQPT
jgi:hypothetical protein